MIIGQQKHEENIKSLKDSTPLVDEWNNNNPDELHVRFMIGKGKNPKYNENHKIHGTIAERIAELEKSGFNEEEVKQKIMEERSIRI